MKRSPFLNLVLALSLAVILPLEQGHCILMGFQSNSASCCMASAAPASANTAMHACCRAAAARKSAQHRLPGSIPESCLCAQLPMGTLPIVSVSASANLASSFLAARPAASIVAPVSHQGEILPALDVGSPPLPSCSGTLGSRAPPVSA